MKTILLCLLMAVPSAAASVQTSPTPKTRVFVRTVPQGAQITVDGKALGVSDGLFLVPPGVRKLTIEMDGFDPETKRVDVKEGWITRVEVSLKKPKPSRQDHAAKTAANDPFGAPPSGSEEASEPDPFGAPPPDPKLQAEGGEILMRMIEANRHWLLEPPKAVKSYEFLYLLGDERPKTYKVADAAKTHAALRQGTTYYSSLHVLAEEPESVTCTAIQRDAKTITLKYSLKESIACAYGNGLEGHWLGYFQPRQPSFGTLVLDAKRFTPLVHRIEGVEERFSEYVSFGRTVLDAIHQLESQDQRSWGYVPKRIEIVHDQLGFDWRFTLHEPGLWILRQGYSIQGTERQLTATLHVLRVNGKNTDAKNPDDTDAETPIRWNPMSESNETTLPPSRGAK